MGCAKGRLLLCFYRKEIASLTQERKEVLLTPSQIPSPRNRMRDERNCTGLQGLLQTKYQCDSLIKDRKALLAELDKEVRASGAFPG